MGQGLFVHVTPDSRQMRPKNLRASECTFLGLSLSVVALALAGCGSEAALPSAAAAWQGRQTFTPGHLYVAQGDDVASKVYRYRLDGNGLPSRKPDGVLLLDFTFPGGIAIGPDGELYVSSSGNGTECQHKCFVDVFAAGASGRAKPIRRLDTPEGPLFVAVDQHGYLDVRITKIGKMRGDFD
jgi:hypothetical protein